MGFRLRRISHVTLQILGDIFPGNFVIITNSIVLRVEAMVGSLNQMKLTVFIHFFRFFGIGCRDNKIHSSVENQNVPRKCPDVVLHLIAFQRFGKCVLNREGAFLVEQLHQFRNVESRVKKDHAFHLFRKFVSHQRRNQSALTGSK